MVEMIVLRRCEDALCISRGGALRGPGRQGRWTGFFAECVCRGLWRCELRRQIFESIVELAQHVLFELSIGLLSIAGGVGVPWSFNFGNDMAASLYI